MWPNVKLILEHPNSDRYAGQRIFVVRREDDAYLVPFFEDEHTVSPKTIIRALVDVHLNKSKYQVEPTV
jgi:hypothetical protein